MVWRRVLWCGGGRPGVEESALMWRRAPWCGGECPGVEESALMWRAPWCGGEGEGSDGRLVFVVLVQINDKQRFSNVVTTLYAASASADIGVWIKKN